jgi:hypothetical protein
MPRPRKAVHVRRIELRLAEEEPLLLELTQEAQLRGVELTQHIHDLLRGRYLIRRGQSLTNLLWVPALRPNRRHPHRCPHPTLRPAQPLIWRPRPGPSYST